MKSCCISGVWILYPALLITECHSSCTSGPRVGWVAGADRAIQAPLPRVLTTENAFYRQQFLCPVTGSGWPGQLNTLGGWPVECTERSEQQQSENTHCTNSDHFKRELGCRLKIKSPRVILYSLEKKEGESTELRARMCAR